MDDLVNRKVKVSYSDDGKTVVIRGILKAHDTHTLTIIGERDGEPVVIGKSSLIKLNAIDNNHNGGDRA